MIAGNRGQGRGKNSSYRAREYLTPNEVEFLANAAAKCPRVGVRNKCLVLLSYRHGLRVSEAISLKWDQVDLERKVVFVTRVKNGKSGTHPLTNREVLLLTRLSKNRKSDMVFSTETGERLDRSTVRKMVQASGVRAKLDFSVHPHMLRHGCGYKLINDGVDVRTVQEYLGHVNIANTVTYTALSEGRFKGLWRD